VGLLIASLARKLTRGRSGPSKGNCVISLLLGLVLW
jgi:POT family proton-dependent oligopeptide transporter